MYMLKYYVRRSAGEELQPVAHPPGENVWVHANTVTDHELHELADAFSMDLNVLRDVLDRHELPRVEMNDGGMYVFMRTASKDKHGTLVTAPLLLAVKGTVFANISHMPIDMNLATPSHLTRKETPIGFLLGTFAAVVSEYEELMKRSGKYINDTGNRLQTHEVTNRDFVKFVTVEDDLNEYNMNLNSMLVVAERLHTTFKVHGDREAVEDIMLYIRQLIVAIESQQQSITSIRNAYSTIANNTLNQRMKILTVLTLIVALPNVLFGMYGMNVQLPLQDAPWAYTAVVSASIVVMLLVLTITRKKGIF